MKWINKRLFVSHIIGLWNALPQDLVIVVSMIQLKTSEIQKKLKRPRDGVVCLKML